MWLSKNRTPCSVVSAIPICLHSRSTTEMASAAMVSMRSIAWLNFLAPGSDSPADEPRHRKLRMLLGGLGLQSMPRFQILIPVFVFGLQRGNLRIAMLLENF